AAEGAVALLGAFGAGEDLVGDAPLGEHPGEAGDVPLVGRDDESAQLGLEVADRVGGDDGPVVGGVEDEARARDRAVRAAGAGQQGGEARVAVPGAGGGWRGVGVRRRVAGVVGGLLGGGRLRLLLLRGAVGLLGAGVA